MQLFGNSNQPKRWTTFLHQAHSTAEILSFRPGPPRTRCRWWTWQGQHCKMR